MISPRRRLDLLLAGRLIRRCRPRIWWNYVKYKRAVARVRRDGPDRLNFAPPSAVIWVTARCNKACAFCHYRGELNPPDYPALELSHERFVRLIRHPLLSRAARVCLYGGEPLLNADLFKMIRSGKRRGHLVTVNTNGLLIAERLDEIRRDPPDLLSVSYYPEDGRALAAALPRVSPRVTVRLLFLLSDATLEQVPDVLRLADETGVRAVSFERICPNEGTGETGPVIDEARLADLKSQMDATHARRLDITWPAPSPGRTPTCRFFWNSLFVDARGRTSPCCVWPMRTYQGDILADESVWNSERMTALRERMRRNDPPELCRSCSYLFDDPLGI